MRDLNGVCCLDYLGDFCRRTLYRDYRISKGVSSPNVTTSAKVTVAVLAEGEDRLHLYCLSPTASGFVRFLLAGLAFADTMVCLGVETVASVGGFDAGVKDLDAAWPMPI